MAEDSGSSSLPVGSAPGGEGVEGQPGETEQQSRGRSPLVRPLSTRSNDSDETGNARGEVNDAIEEVNNALDEESELSPGMLAMLHALKKSFKFTEELSRKHYELKKELKKENAELKASVREIERAVVFEDYDRVIFRHIMDDARRAVFEGVTEAFCFVHPLHVRQLALKHLKKTFLDEHGNLSFRGKKGFMQLFDEVAKLRMRKPDGIGLRFVGSLCPGKPYEACLLFLKSMNTKLGKVAESLDKQLEMPPTQPIEVQAQPPVGMTAERFAQEQIANTIDAMEKLQGQLETLRRSNISSSFMIDRAIRLMEHKLVKDHIFSRDDLGAVIRDVCNAAAHPANYHPRAVEALARLADTPNVDSDIHGALNGAHTILRLAPSSRFVYYNSHHGYRNAFDRTISAYGVRAGFPPVYPLGAVPGRPGSYYQKFVEELEGAPGNPLDVELQYDDPDDFSLGGSLRSGGSGTRAQSTHESPIGGASIGSFSLGQTPPSGAWDVNSPRPTYASVSSPRQIPAGGQATGASSNRNVSQTSSTQPGGGGAIPAQSIGQPPAAETGDDDDDDGRSWNIVTHKNKSGGSRGNSGRGGNRGGNRGNHGSRGNRGTGDGGAMRRTSSV